MSLTRAELRQRVHGPNSALVAADWNPDLHPRGSDGRFIEIGWLINLIDMAGFRHGQRGKKEVQGEVIDIIPDPEKPGDPIIRVKMTDPRWEGDKFGHTFDARSYQVSQREPTKAKISKPSVPPTPPPDTPTPPIVKSSMAVGTPLPPMGKPPNWDSLSTSAKHQWVKDQMEADLAAFRGEPTIFDLAGTGPEMEHALAERYRWLTHIDPDTALRVDAVVTDQQASTVGDPRVKPGGPGAIAVAHPGTDHPGGIGPVVGKRAIVLGQSYFQDDKLWQKTKGMNSGKSMPWSVGSTQGDETSTLVHEFGHQRQFRYLSETLLEVGQPFSKVGQSDGFGTMPDSSNWPETQAARYAIQNLAPSAYGKSKSSEAYAEVWVAVTTDYEPVSPELQAAWDTWHSGMSIPSQMPQTRYDPAEVKPYHMLSPQEKDEYWAEYGPLIELPGMREHYPDTAKLYDAWEPNMAPTPAGPEEAVPIDFGKPLRSTVGATHPGFDQRFNVEVDALEGRFGDLTNDALAYIGTGEDEQGRAWFLEGLQFQAAASSSPFGSMMASMEADALTDGGVESIWDLPSMKGTFGQVISTPNRILMIVNPRLDPDEIPESELFEHPGLTGMQATIVHEYGHAIHRSVQRKTMANPDSASYLLSWTEMMGENPITTYGSRSMTESLAEKFVRYYHEMEGGEGWEEFIENSREILGLSEGVGAAI